MGGEKDQEMGVRVRVNTRIRGKLQVFYKKYFVRSIVSRKHGACKEGDSLT